MELDVECLYTAASVNRTPHCLAWSPLNDALGSPASDAITSDAPANDVIIFGSSDAVCVANLENGCVKIVETLSGEEQKQVRIG